MNRKEEFEIMQRLSDFFKAEAAYRMRPKDLYHMIFYAATSIMGLLVFISTAETVLSVSKLLGGLVCLYALFKMHKIIEGV